MRKVYAWLLCTLIFAGAALAQEKTISGKVTSAADDSPLPFVAVAVKGTTKGVNSDLDGNYRIAGVTAKDSLVFSFVGFEPQTVAVGNQLVINVKLKPTVQQLEAV